MNLFSLIAATNTEESSFELAVSLGLINISEKLCICGRAMHIERGKTRHGFNGRWRCSHRACRKSLSIFTGTVFAGNKLGITQVLRILYLHTMEVKTKHIAAEVGVDRHAVYKVISDFMDVVDNAEPNPILDMLGGVGHIVEVDETHMCTRRDNRGRILQGERVWIFGAVERATGKLALQITNYRTVPDCSEFITDNIRVGTHIMTDCWRGYNRLEHFGYTHSRVNHSLHFVDPDNPNIHTQKIERVWKDLKEKCVNTSSLEYIKKLAKRYVHMKNNHINSASSWFDQLISLNNYS